ncbi:MAG TPA: xanthine dehydrogenase family protein molybdopterin-binding subunit [Burkholderiales bacterium]|nr:xanthine dehydrogenase family protein molybdopterin-binding subunit [Burkholderiales bacterium]
MHYGNRIEDLRLVTGQGKYAADWTLPGQLFAHFLRSDRAHARITGIDTAAALRQPGVKAILTGADAVAAGYTQFLQMLSIPGRGGNKILPTARPVLAHGAVRYVGEAVAMVVADSALVAQDAAELIEVSYQDLPAAVTPEAALASGAPQLHANVPGNVAFDYEAGDDAATAAAFAAAAHVTRVTVESTRVVPSPMEPRSGMVAYDAAAERYSVYVPIQGINMMRLQLATLTGLPEDKFVVHARDIGGSFGQRSTAYPEYAAMLIAAKRLGKPVRWIGSRSEGFLTDTHGRSNTITGELALDRDGKFLGMRIGFVCDMGAYLSPAGPQSHVRNPTTCLTGVYRIPALYGRWRVVLTNTAPVAAYRGAGRPDIAYIIERLVSQAAAETGIDPAELRRRNFIPRSAFPYKTPTGSTYEEADFGAVLDKALALSDYAGFAARRSESQGRGRLRGIGVSTVIENTGAGIFPKDQVLLEVGADGGVDVYTVSQSQGQSHETTFAMVVGEALGIAHEKVRIRQGVNEKPLIGNHTGGSRSTAGAGSVCKLAALKLIEQGKSLAAVELNVEPSQVEYEAGVFRARESGKSVGLAQLAQKHAGARPNPLDVLVEATVGSTFPNGCHVTEVEIDPDTGTPEIKRYTAVDDTGFVVNHAVVEGQIHGAVTQGAGQVFGEHAVYDAATGQLLAGSFMDYVMPRAGMIRAMQLDEQNIPSKTNSLGAKGVGEAGCGGSIPALTNAVLDALRPLGVRHLDMPLTPNKLWHAIRNGNAKQ